MNLKEHYKARLSEGLFNQNNPIVKAVTGVKNLIRGRPFGGGTHEVTSVPRRDPKMWTRKDSETREQAREIAGTRQKIMDLSTTRAGGAIIGDPILEPGRIPNPELVQKAHDEIVKNRENPDWFRQRELDLRALRDAALRANASDSNIRRNSSTSYS